MSIYTIIANELSAYSLKIEGQMKLTNDPEVVKVMVDKMDAVTQFAKSVFKAIEMEDAQKERKMVHGLADAFFGAVKTR